MSAIGDLVRRLPDSFTRPMKAARNLVTDPPPRNTTLHIRKVSSSGRSIELTYAASGRTYVNKVALEADLTTENIPESAREELLVALALAMSPHLFVLTDFQTVHVECGALSDGQLQFWSWYLRGGLGQFRYQQGLDPAREVQVTTPRMRTPSPSFLAPPDERALILNGGGKDTAVAAELMRALGVPFEWLSVNPNRARRALIEASGTPVGHDVRFEIDRSLLRAARYDRRHVPYVAVYMTLGVIVAASRRMRYVVLGNERSADFGNVVVNGVEVNHQFSKTHEFESAFQTHVCDALGLDVHVFSILRPFYEVRLGRLFSALPRYFHSFVSCNQQGPESVWCGQCAKCAFIALALSPFLPEGMREEIFGTDPVGHASIRKHWLDLVREGVKPWECVGTKDESRLALALFLERYPTLDFAEAPRRSELAREVAGLDVGRLTSEYLDGFHGPHNVPAHLVDELRRQADAISGRAASQRAITLSG